MFPMFTPLKLLQLPAEYDGIILQDGLAQQILRVKGALPDSGTLCNPS